jgi:outer membrane lipase/esterase
MRYDVNRIVPIGITQQSNVGNTSGRNTSLAAEFGYDFVAPLGPAAAPSMYVKAPPSAPGLQITHGPVAGIVLQHIRVDGFTETDQFGAVGGFTALSFAAQTRNSAISELGYHASVDIGIWQPFVKLVWNHELVSSDRSVTASLTSMVAPSFSMPAVVLGRDWATGTVGTSARIGQGVTAYAAFTGEMVQRDVVAYGGQVGVNVALH